MISGEAGSLKPATAGKPDAAIVDKSQLQGGTTNYKGIAGNDLH